MISRLGRLGFFLPSFAKPREAQSGLALAEPQKTKESADSSDERTEEEMEADRATLRFDLFRHKCEARIAAWLGIDVFARCKIYVLADVPYHALDWMPGLGWKGPNATMPGFSLASSKVLRSIHSDDLLDYHGNPHKLTRTSFETLIENGNSLLLCVRDLKTLPACLSMFKYTVLSPPGDLFCQVMTALREAMERSNFPKTSISMPGNPFPKSIHDAIDERGRIRGPYGWVSGKLPIGSLSVLKSELSLQLDNGCLDLSRLLDLVSGGTRIEIGSQVQKLGELETENAPSLEEMAGIRRIRKRIRRLISRMDKGQRKGILMHGPPGTGKTMLARTIAKGTGRNLVIGSHSEWASTGERLAEHVAAMRATFDEAREKQPSILFIDEMDSVGKRNAHSSEYLRIYVNSFIELLDGFKDRGDVVVLGATNHLDEIDPAILRHGRFGEHLEIPVPDMEDTAEIVDWYLEKASVDGQLPRGRSPYVTGRAISLRCFTASSATVRAMVEEAVALAREEDAELSLDHFSAAMVNATTNGVDGKHEMTPEQLYRVAIHEMGHAAAVHLLFGGRAKIGLATVRPGLGSLGHVVWEFDKGKGPDCVADNAARIVIALAGRSAEILHGGLGALGFGAGSDLENARSAAQFMVTHGMLPARADGFVDQRDEKEVYKAASDWLTHLHRETLSMLAPHLVAIRDIARELQEHGDMDGGLLASRMTANGLVAGGRIVKCD